MTSALTPTGPRTRIKICGLTREQDVDAAVEGVLIAKYRNTGQTCVCANRILVQGGVYQAFAGKLAARVAALQVGAGTEPGVVQGR